MPKPRYHVFVCTTDRPAGHPRGSCGEKGSQDLMMKFMEEVQNRNLMGEVLITGSSCLGPCMMGPTVVVYPDGVWYRGVAAKDVEEIVSKHFTDGKPVERLMIPDQMWG